jgi:Outer membrane protein beta-barrel domain
MPSMCTAPIGHIFRSILALGALMAVASPVSAQGFGVGGRLAWVRSDADIDVDSVRFIGGQIRLLAPRIGIEVSLDRRSESFELLNEKVTETPLQASLLLRLASGGVSPYLLGGPGWYRRKVETIDGGGDLSVTTTEFGWHAGAGLEIRPTRRFGLHGDYRYTFLDFGDDEDEDSGLITGLLPGHKGSMWTVGATLYF